MPWSTTLTFPDVASVCIETRIGSAVGEYLIAFEIRLSRICAKRARPIATRTGWAGASRSILAPRMRARAMACRASAAASTGASSPGVRCSALRRSAMSRSSCVSWPCTACRFRDLRVAALCRKGDRTGTDDRGKPPVASELRERAAWKISDDDGPVRWFDDRGPPRRDPLRCEHGRREDAGLRSLAADLADRSRGVVEGAQLLILVRPLERRGKERGGVANEVVDGSRRHRSVLLLDRVERDPDRQWGIDRDRDRQSGHVRHDALEGRRDPERPRRHGGGDHLGTRRG